jgi:hypothetical protein
LSALYLNQEPSEYEVEVKTSEVGGYSDGLDGRGLTAGRGSKCFSSSYNPDWLLRPSILQFIGYCGDLSPGVKRPGRDHNQLPSPSAEIKKAGAIYPLPHKT